MIMTRVPPPLEWAVPGTAGASVVAVAEMRSERRAAGAAATWARGAALDAAPRVERRAARDKKEAVC